MKKITSKYKGLFLLLILLVAGWLTYNFQKKPTNPWNEKLPAAHQMPRKLLQFSGVVLKYGSNHDGDIDKILLSTNDNKIWLHFPPHTARQITEIARINKTIEATVHQQGLPGHNAGDVYELKYLRSEFPKSALDLTQIPAPVPKTGTEVEIKSIVSKDLKIENEQETNFILAGKLISLPPHMARELLPMIRQGKIIIVKGQMRDSSEGFLSSSGVNVVKPNAIQIDSITYKIR